MTKVGFGTSPLACSSRNRGRAREMGLKPGAHTVGGTLTQISAVMGLLLLGVSIAVAAPLKVLVSPMSAEQMAELKRVAPNVELVVANSERDALSKVADADAT